MFVAPRIMPRPPPFAKIFCRSCGTFVKNAHYRAWLERRSTRSKFLAAPPPRDSDSLAFPSPCCRSDRAPSGKRVLTLHEWDFGVTPRDRTEPTTGPLLAAARLAIQIPAHLARLLVRGYRYTLSPLVGFHCRHLPTCSDYADQAFGRFGFWAGGWMTLGRLCRCHPLGTSGLDFVCEELPARSRWYLPWRYARWRGTNATAPERADRPRSSSRLPGS